MNHFDRVNKNLKKIILENSYSNIELLGIEKFYREPVEEEKKEEKPAIEKEKEDTKAAEEEIEEQKTKESLKIQVLNGNYIIGSATVTAGRIEELGYKNFDIGNVEGGEVYENSLIYYRDGLSDYAGEIGQYLDVDKAFIQSFEDEAASDFDILIIVGLDFREE